eukprot:comp16902_c1_seq1/m.15433 comp16902_c1_seq1/g.15433  ORF comp16902_c1_seq1/g.15433 comp16902_c1_seq1/m.15433 type:complete len:582 (-) comp16902_c1_seq1:232-1977(-)
MDSSRRSSFNFDDSTNEEHENGGAGAEQASGNSKEKPSCSFPTLIARAIMLQGGSTTLAGIYNYFIETHPYFKTSPANWRNRVRHTLTVSKCFTRIPCGNRRRGGLWTIHPEYTDSFLPDGTFVGRRGGHAAAQAAAAAAAAGNGTGQHNSQCGSGSNLGLEDSPSNLSTGSWGQRERERSESKSTVHFSSPLVSEYGNNDINAMLGSLWDRAVDGSGTQESHSNFPPPRKAGGSITVGLLQHERALATSSVADISRPGGLRRSMSDGNLAGMLEEEYDENVDYNMDQSDGFQEMMGMVVGVGAGNGWGQAPNPTVTIKTEQARQQQQRGGPSVGGLWGEGTGFAIGQWGNQEPQVSAKQQTWHSPHASSQASNHNTNGGGFLDGFLASQAAVGAETDQHRLGRPTQPPHRHSMTGPFPPQPMASMQQNTSSLFPPLEPTSNVFRLHNPQHAPPPRIVQQESSPTPTPMQMDASPTWVDAINRPTEPLKESLIFELDAHDVEAKLRVYNAIAFGGKHTPASVENIHRLAMQLMKSAENMGKMSIDDFSVCYGSRVALTTQVEEEEGEGTYEGLSNVDITAW